MRKEGALGEDSCSVPAAPFSRPVRPVFVMSDVSIKTRAAIRNHPPLNDRTATATPVLHRDQRHLSPATLPQTPSVFLPLPLTNTPEGLIVPGGHTPDIRVEKKKEQWRGDRRRNTCLKS